MRQSNLFRNEEPGHIGTDESGKGDYFGPLCVAGVFLPDDQHAVLAELGVKDSKRLTDKRALNLASLIKKNYKHSIVAIGPARYNELYAKLRNLNRLLAWAHARVIENMLAEVDCRLAITDQFGDKQFVNSALMKRGKEIELIQRTKAESDMAVAAASILARAEFLQRLSSLSNEIAFDLPKGSSPPAEKAGRELVRKYGPAVLDRAAKKHFKLTDRILQVS